MGRLTPLTFADVGAIFRPDTDWSKKRMTCGIVSLVPAFEIGVWNAWVLQIFFFLTISVPGLLVSKQAKERTKRVTESVPFSKTNKTLAIHHSC